LTFAVQTFSFARVNLQIV